MVKLGKLFPVKIPKQVSIQNGKLSIFKVSVQITVVSLLLYQFIQERMYLVVQIPQGFPNAWVEVAKPTAQAVRDDFDSAICRDNLDYLYEYSASWTHGSYQCIKTADAEAGFKLGKKQIYFPTYFRETHGETTAGSTNCNALCAGEPSCADASLGNPPTYNFGRKCKEQQTETMPVLHSSQTRHDETSVTTCACKKQSHFLVAGVASRAMGFEHIFKVSAAEEEISGSSGASKAVADESENKLPVVSIIMRKDGDTFTEFDCYSEKVRRQQAAFDRGAASRPSVDASLQGKCRFSETPEGGPDDVWMTLQDWVAAASGGSIDLANADARNPDIASNRAFAYSDDPEKKMAPYRLTGVEVLVSIEYIAPAFHHRIPEAVDLNGFGDYMVALVKLSVNQAMWTGYPVVAYGSPAVSSMDAANFNAGTYRERYHYGIRFLFMTSTSSAYGSFSLMDMLTGLAVFKVYYGAAGAVIALFALTALGALSVQYKRVCESTVDLEYEATKVAPTKILIAVAAYEGLCKMLEDQQPNILLTDANGKKVIPLRKLDAAVLSRCFEKVFASGRIQLHDGGIEAITESTLRALGDRATGNLDVEKFTNAFMSSDFLDLVQLQKVFDPNRKVGRMEAFFSAPLEFSFACLEEKRDDDSVAVGDGKTLDNGAAEENRGAREMRMQ